MNITQSAMAYFSHETNSQKFTSSCFCCSCCCSCWFHCLHCSRNITSKFKFLRSVTITCIILSFIILLASILHVSTVTPLTLRSIKTSMKMMNPLQYNTTTNAVVMEKEGKFYFRGNPFMMVWPSIMTIVFCFCVLIELFVSGGWVAYSFHYHATELKKFSFFSSSEEGGVGASVAVVDSHVNNNDHNRSNALSGIVRICGVMTLVIMCCILVSCYLVLVMTGLFMKIRNKHDHNKRLILFNAFEYPALLMLLVTCFTSLMWLSLLCIRYYVTSWNKRDASFNNTGSIAGGIIGSGIAGNSGGDYMGLDDEDDEDDEESSKSPNNESSKLYPSSSYYHSRIHRTYSNVHSSHSHHHNYRNSISISRGRAILANLNKKFRNCRIFVGTFLLWLILIAFWTLTVLALRFMIHNALSRIYSARHFPPPGRLIRLNRTVKPVVENIHLDSGLKQDIEAIGPLLHLHCEWMNGHPISNATNHPQLTIVLESDVASVGSMSWSLLFPKLLSMNSSSSFDAQVNRKVCWYDRAGYGWSQLGHFPRTGDIIATELYHLLRHAGELSDDTNQHQLVLVGHSRGAHLVRIFQAIYPQYVAGMVLIDSPSANSTWIQSELNHKTWLQTVRDNQSHLKQLRFVSFMEPLGLTKDYYKYSSYIVSRYMKEHGQCDLMCASAVGAASIYNNRWTLATYAEQYDLALTEQQVLSLQSSSNYTAIMANLPLGIFTAGANINGTCDLGANAQILHKMGIISDYKEYCAKYEDKLKIWGPIHYREQEKLSQLSTKSIWKIFWESRHTIQWDYPNELAEGIQQIVAMAEDRFLQQRREKSLAYTADLENLGEDERLI